MTLEARAPGRNWGAWAVHGVIGGAVAGIIFAMFEMGWGLATGGIDMAAAPLRMIGGIALGPSAMDQSYSLVTAAVARVAVTWPCRWSMGPRLRSGSARSLRGLE